MELFEADLKKYPESVKLALLNTSQLVITLSDQAKANAIKDKVTKIRQAEDRLRKAIKIDSSCGGCYNNLSFMLLTYDRDPAAALPYLLLGYKRDSTKKEMTCNIGIAYFRLGEARNAEKYLLMAIKQDKKKDFSVPYEVLQDLYTRNDPQKGFTFFKEKLKENPESELYNVLLGKSYFEVRDTANSIRYYNEALKINPNNTNVSSFVTRLEAQYSKNNW
jgi:tetratricopeptide (TPR) repeat protein